MESSLLAVAHAGDSEAGLSCAPSEKGTLRPVPPTGAFSILVASAAAAERHMVAEILTAEGYAVTLAENGETALARAGKDRFDLVVASVVMPRFDGLELLRALSTSQPSLPVILLAPGHSKIDQVYLKCAELMGAAGAHAQPLRPKAFLAIVRKGLAGASKTPKK